MNECIRLFDRDGLAHCLRLLSSLNGTIRLFDWDYLDNLTRLFSYPIVSFETFWLFDWFFCFLIWLSDWDFKALQFLLFSYTIKTIRLFYWYYLAIQLKLCVNLIENIRMYVCVHFSMILLPHFYPPFCLFSIFSIFSIFCLCNLFESNYHLVHFGMVVISIWKKIISDQCTLKVYGETCLGQIFMERHG